MRCIVMCRMMPLIFNFYSLTSFHHLIVSVAQSSLSPECVYAWVRVYLQVRTFSSQVCFYRLQTLRGKRHTPLSVPVLFAYAVFINDTPEPCTLESDLVVLSTCSFHLQFIFNAFVEVHQTFLFARQTDSISQNLSQSGKSLLTSSSIRVNSFVVEARLLFHPVRVLGYTITVWQFALIEKYLKIIDKPVNPPNPELKFRCLCAKQIPNHSNVQGQPYWMLQLPVLQEVPGPVPSLHDPRVSTLGSLAWTLT